jgi:dolichol-phosphate mannosyltransferase
VNIKVLVCIPTYNEVENIGNMIRAIFSIVSTDVSLIVIDDDSPDGTASVVEALMPNYENRLYIHRRHGKQGGASAFLWAFQWGLDNGFDAMLAMDADFSHDPKYIPEIIRQGEKYDLVIGSRLVKGGGIENRSVSRNILSKCASIYCRVMLGSKIKDWTGGYNLWTKKSLQAIDVKTVFTRGYSFQIEMKYKAMSRGCTVCEVPIVFPDRKYGVSKMSSTYLLKALLDVWRIKFPFLNKSVVKQALKFAITGGLGTITNLALFFIFADKLGFYPTAVSVGCFLIAGLQNYLVNHRWSFSNMTQGSKPSLKGYLLFLSASLIGLIVNISIMNAILYYFKPPYKVIAQAFGILGGMVLNFICSKSFVFRGGSKK